LKLQAQVVVANWQDGVKRGGDVPLSTNSHPEFKNIIARHCNFLRDLYQAELDKEPLTEPQEDCLMETPSMAEIKSVKTEIINEDKKDPPPLAKVYDSVLKIQSAARCFMACNKLKAAKVALIYDSVTKIQSTARCFMVCNKLKAARNNAALMIQNLARSRFARAERKQLRTNRVSEKALVVGLRMITHVLVRWF
jgi:hypothetical protein